MLEPLLPGREGSWGGVAQDNRRFINAVLWVPRTGAPWRDLPADYGGWSNTHRRFCRWRDKGYDTNAITEAAQAAGMEVVIPPRSNRKDPANTTITSTSCATWWKTPS